MVWETGLQMSDTSTYAGCVDASSATLLLCRHSVGFIHGLMCLGISLSLLPPCEGLHGGDASKVKLKPSVNKFTLLLP